MIFHIDKLSWIDVKKALPTSSDNEVLVLIYNKANRIYYIQTAVRFTDMWEIIFHDDTLEIYDNDNNNDEKVIAWAKYPTASIR